MRTWIRRCGLTLAVGWVVTVPGATDAGAQVIRPWVDRVFVNVSFGSQPKARRAAQRETFSLYDELATWQSVIGTGSSSVSDVTGGVRLWRNIGVGAAFTRYSDPTSATIDASVPDPLFFDQAHAESAALPDLRHVEKAVHLSAVVVIPLIERLDLTVFGGPSFFSLSKDIVDMISVRQGGTDITDVTRRRHTVSPAGGHLGIDVAYMLTRHVGAGVFVRFASASASTDVFDGGTIDVGGANYGGGVRVRF